MNSSEMKAICSAAIDAACVPDGPRKGAILAACPPMDTNGAAAWHALVKQMTPYKVSMARLLGMTAQQRAIYDAIEGAIASGST